MNIILTGFMGTGKTSVSNELAKILGWEIIDTDELIVQKENRSINDIFSKDGEQYFRKIESEIIEQTAKLDKKIISTGGGAVLNPKNIENLKENGIVFCLSAKPETIFERLKTDDSRPLLKVENPLKKIKEMLEIRAKFYANNNYEIDTTNLSVDEIAKQIIGKIPEIINVNLKENSYKIYVGKPFSELVHFLPKIKSKKILVISDEIVAKKYLVDFMESLKDEFDLQFHLIPSGEEHKNLDEINKIYKACVEHKMDRNSLIIALGGGVVGDMSGFAAATYLRGINFVQVPTTLLAQVDASIGGKTGVDLPEGKNLVGAFHQPKLVWIDPEFLKTLDEREFKNGLFEVVKYGVICKGFWKFLEKNMEKISHCVRNDKENNVINKMLVMCARAKADVVSKDEKESGLRKILNFGHTLGHALETNLNYKYKHGEMVAVGMLFATYLAVELKICDKNVEIRLKSLLNKIGFVFDKNEMDIEDILKIMANDKKMNAGKIDFILPEKFGKVRIENLDLEIIRKFLNKWRING